MASNAQTKRFDALVAINDKFLPADNRYTPRTMDVKEAVMVEILNIRAMGRTDRWMSACAEWYSMVVKAEDVDTLRWAIIEGSNKANYANI